MFFFFQCFLIIFWFFWESGFAAVLVLIILIDLLLIYFCFLNYFLESPSFWESDFTTIVFSFMMWSDIGDQWALLQPTKNGQVSQRDNDLLEVPEKHMAAYILIILQTFLIFFHILRAFSIGWGLYVVKFTIFQLQKLRTLKIKMSSCHGQVARPAMSSQLKTPRPKAFAEPAVTCCNVSYRLYDMYILYMQ